MLRGGRGRPCLLLVCGLAENLFCHAPALEQGSERRLQAAVERCRAVPHRRTRRHHFRNRCERRSGAEPSRHPQKLRRRKESPRENPDLSPGARFSHDLCIAVDRMFTSPDGSKLAFVTNAINQRQEKYEDVEIYVVNVATGATASRVGLPKTRAWNRNCVGPTTIATSYSPSK